MLNLILKKYNKPKVNYLIVFVTAVIFDPVTKIVTIKTICFSVMGEFKP